MEIRRAIALLAAVLGCNGQNSGSFTATNHMTSPRSGHTATLLANGKVLIAGGGTLTAEIYDPSAGIFAPTGNMTYWHLGTIWQSWRIGQTATLLPDGRVLITGAGSAELYDPAIETFRATGPMSTGGVSATLLNTGKVLVVGGHCTGDGGNTITASSNAAELYDPSTDTFMSTGNMTTGRCNPRGTLLRDGRVLILPSEEGDDYDRAEVYNPTTGTFSALDWNGNGGVAAASNLLVNGTVLAVVAWQECDAGSEQAVLYDSAAGSFSVIGGMVTSICRPTGTLLSDGKALIAAGPFAGPLAQLYDPATRRFSATANLSSERISHAATLLNDGSVLITGGMSSVGGPFDYRYGFTILDTAELYHPAAVVPALALLSHPGSNQGAILHAGTSRVVSASDPATSGEVLEIYCTGLVDGGVVPPEIAIGVRFAEILYFGKAPGFAGLNQINVRVPDGIAAGAAVSVHLRYLGRMSNTVTIGVNLR